MFLAAASFSGPLDPLGSLSFFDQVVPNALWGNSKAQADVWKAHDPTDNAAALKGTALYVAYGNGKMDRWTTVSRRRSIRTASWSETLRSRAHPSSISSRP
jgi:S-formylglutathione hydrolase FrmB